MIQYPWRYIAIAMLCSLSTLLHAQTCPLTVAPVNVCEGETAYFEMTFTAGNTYDWNVTGPTAIVGYSSNGNKTGAGTATGPENGIYVKFGNGTSATINLIMRNSGGTVVCTVSHPVTIRPRPNPAITSSFSSACLFYTENGGNVDAGLRDPDEACFTVCENSIVDYDPQNIVSGDVVSWSVSGHTGTPTFTNNTMTVPWGAPGNGKVTLTVTNQWGCVETVEKCIVIVEAPEAQFSSIPAANGGVITVCPDQKIFFTDLSTSSPKSPITNWYWDFGDGEVSLDQNPTKAYATPGPYNASLTVTNTCGCTDVITFDVDVLNVVPIAIECAGPVCLGDVVEYTVPSVCTTYNWSVNNAGTIKSASPYGNKIVVEWNNGSSAPGVVTIDGANCPGYCPLPVSEVVPILDANMSIAGPTIVCPNDQAIYSLPQLKGANIVWSATGNGTAIGSPKCNEFVVDWGASGSGTVSAVVTHPFLTCTTNISITVNIRPEYVISGPDKACPNLPSGTYTYAVSAGGSFDWDMYDASGNLVNSQAGGSSYNPVFPAGGVFKIVATYVSGGPYCNQVDEFFVTVADQPADPPIPFGADPVCPNSTHEYWTTTTSPDYFLEWTITDGTANGSTTANGSRPTVLWGPSGGSYQLEVRQVMKNAPGCASPGLNLKTVTEIVPASPIITGPNVGVCGNTIQTYTTTTVAQQYNWSISPTSAGSIILGQGTNTISVQWNNNTSPADVELEAIICGSPFTGSLTVGFLTIIPPTITHAGPYCQGDVVTLAVTPAGSSYNWSVSGTQVGNTISFPANNDGTFNAQVTVNNLQTCPINMDAATSYIVKPSPVGQITVDGSLSYCIATGGAPPTLVVGVQGATTQYSYEWYAGLCGGPVLANTIRWQPPGPGTYYAKAISPNGCETCFGPVTVTQGCPTSTPCTPTSGCSFTGDFTPNATITSCGTTVNFNATGGGTFLGWSFGDGSTGSTRTMSHTYPNRAGTYRVIASFNECGCDYSVEHQIDIPYIPDFTWEITCNPGGGYDAKFIDLTDWIDGHHGFHKPDPTEYQWSGLPCGSSFAVQPVCTLAPGGTYSVTMRVKSFSNVICTVTKTVVIPNAPIPDFTIPAARCEEQALQFNNMTTGNAVAWEWTYDGSAMQNLQHGVQSFDVPPTNHNAELKVTDNYGCESKVLKNFSVEPNVLQANVGPTPSSFCNGGNVTLTATGSHAVSSYLWSTTEITSSISATQTGQYYVTITDADGCSASAGPAEVSVKYIPIPSIAGKVEYCAGEQVCLNANEGAAYTYNWSVSSGGTSSTEEFKQSGLAAGTYTATVTMTDPSTSCVASAIQTFDVYTPIPPSLTSSPTPPCEGTPVTLTASPVGNYNWSNGKYGNGIQVLHAGPYRARYVDINGCEADATTDVYPLPDFDKVPIGCYTLCDPVNLNPGGNYPSWEWKLNNTTHLTGSGAVAAVPVNAPGGSYRLEATTINGCTDISDPVDLNVVGCDPCNITVSVTNVECMGLDANGEALYYVEVQLTTTSFFPMGLTYFINGGVISSASSSTISAATSPQTVGIWYHRSGITSAPFTEFVNVTARHSVTGATCTQSDRASFPFPCVPPPGPCVPTAVSASGWTLTHLGGGVYDFTLTVNNLTGCALEFTVSSASGTFSNVTSGTLPAGASTITGTFTATLPSGAIQLNVYCPSSGLKCLVVVPYNGLFPMKTGTFNAGNSYGAALKLYPNPSSGITRVEYNLVGHDEEATKQLRVLDQIGRTIYVNDVHAQQGTAQLDLRDLPAGMYAVELRVRGRIVEVRQLVLSE